MAIKWGESTHFPGRTGNRGETTQYRKFMSLDLGSWIFNMQTNFTRQFAQIEDVNVKVKKGRQFDQ
jgi:hypothetical protein